MEQHVLRGRALQALGRVLISGVTAQELPWLRALDELTEVLTEKTPDQLAAEHHRVCEREVFLQESVFLSVDATLGGERESLVRRHLASRGFSPQSAPPDHLGMELLALGWAATQSRDSQSWQRTLVDQHLARWLPVAAVAVRRQLSPLFTPVLELALELVGVHRAALGEASGEQPAEPMPPVDLLDKPKTSLARIARTLLVPASSGIFLSRADLTRLAGDTELPGGFGPRAKMLESIFHTAADQGQVKRLVAALLAVVDDFAAGVDHSSQWDCYQSASVSWRDRHAWTRAVLRRLESAAE